MIETRTFEDTNRKQNETDWKSYADRLSNDFKFLKMELKEGVHLTEKERANLVRSMAVKWICSGRRRGEALNWYYNRMEKCGVDTRGIPMEEAKNKNAFAMYRLRMRFYCHKKHKEAKLQSNFNKIVHMMMRELGRPLRTRSTTES